MVWYFTVVDADNPQGQRVVHTENSIHWREGRDRVG
jgi:hypothetical protein